MKNMMAVIIPMPGFKTVIQNGIILTGTDIWLPINGLEIII